MAKGKITLQMLSELIANNTGRSKTSAEAFVRTFFSTLKEALEKDNIVKVKGLGTFKMVVINARESIDVNTGKRVSIAEYNKISFSPDKNLKDKVNRPFSQFETIVIDDEDISILEARKADEQATAIDEDEATLQNDTEQKTSNVIESGKTEDGARTEHEDNPTAAPVIDNKEQRNETIATHQDQVASQKLQDTEITSTNNNQVAPLQSPTVAESDVVSVEEHDDNTLVSKTKSKWQLWCIPVMIILMAAAYMIGHMRLLDTALVPNVQSKQTVTHTSNVSQQQKKTDNIQTKQKEDGAIDSSNDTIKRFPQIADGKYLITGIKTYRRIKPDYDVRRYCMQIYGREDVLPYVLLLNEINEESSINVGRILKFPNLVEKKSPNN